MTRGLGKQGAQVLGYWGKGVAIATCLAFFTVSCGNDHAAAPKDGGTDGSNDTPFTGCSADAASYVRAAFLALDGRRPKSQDEVDVYVDLYSATQAKGGDPKDAVARAIMAQPEFTERWVDVLMDAIRVQRVDVQGEVGCWGHADRTTVDSSLAVAIRGARSTASGDGKTWTMLDLARSSLALDDVSPIVRAQLFSMVSNPIPAANVGQVEAELARRADFGGTFDAGYLHRDIVCLGCHNSEHSVTDNDDPTLDRFWPVPGLPERAVYGMSTGTAEDAAHAAFRVDGFVGVQGQHWHPWGWDASCGEFVPPASVGDDPAGVSAKLASLTGTRTTVVDLEGSLQRGFDALRGQAPPIGQDGSIADPDTALAWLVTLKITEDAWKQATGTSLTIANYFPRNQASRDVLYALATKFTQSGFSMKALLVAITETDYFNRKPPEDGCGASPYTYPNVFDPWVISDPDPNKHLNGPGDGVTAVDARTLVSATSAALEWGLPPAATRFPDYGEPDCADSSCGELQQACAFSQCCTTYRAACQQGGLLPATELPFERGVGMFLRNSERGFRGLDFQARLTWENRYGACARPAWTTNDFLDRLVAAGAADSTATAGDVAIAIKDRLTGENALADGAETAALAQILGPLDAPASAVSVTAARHMCAALLESPQFLLQGVAARGGQHPKLTPADAGYAAVCANVATHVAGASCDGGKLTLN
jgi:hypothetical protein